MTQNWLKTELQKFLKVSQFSILFSHLIFKLQSVEDAQPLCDYVMGMADGNERETYMLVCEE